VGGQREAQGDGRYLCGKRVWERKKERLRIVILNFLTKGEGRIERNEANWLRLVSHFLFSKISPAFFSS